MTRAVEMAIDVFPCEDGHAQERALLGEVVPDGPSGRSLDHGSHISASVRSWPASRPAPAHSCAATTKACR